MFEKLKTYLQFGNTFCGIEHTLKEGGTQLYATLLKRSKNELVIRDTLRDDSVEGLSKQLRTNQHVSLIINDKSVLFKRIESAQSDPLKIVYKSFPNIEIEDFYFEILSQSNKHFVALCRKEIIDKVVEDYKNYKISVINISLGHTILITIKDYIKKTPFYTSNSKVIVTNNFIETIEKRSIEHETYNLNGLSISNTHLLASAGALRILLDQDLTQSNFYQVKQGFLVTYNHKRFKSQFLKIAGLFVFGVLLVNFFIFNHYFNKVNELKDVAQMNQSAKTQIVALKDVVSHKQKMINDLLKSSASKSSYYSNEIAHSLSGSILLAELNYQPLLKRVKTGKQIELAQNSLIISGSSSDSDEFSRWVSSLEHLPWVNLVEIIDYGSISKNVAEFKLKILLSNDR